ncbi:MAG: hypothetical protein WCF26_05295 [Candidatus Sulfotelmatobacter sp.]
MHADASDRARAAKSYIEAHPYPGLEYVGGVGFVEVVTRSIDEEISSQLYQQLRSEIEASNRNYFKERTDKLAALNDARRRADPAHEALGWRTRVWVTSFTELEHHAPYPLGTESFAYLRIRDSRPSGCTAQLVDIYHRSGGGIDQALLEGTDWAEMLVDSLALAGYGAAHIGRVVGTSVPFSRVGESYELATFQASLLNSAVPISPRDLSCSVDETGRLALRHLRDGLSAPIPTTAFAAFWNSLECLADEEAKARGLKRTTKCECGRERTIGIDTKRVFEAMYTDAGADPSLFDRHRKRRGTIQHGARTPTSDYLSEVLDDLSQLQVAATVAVSKRVGISPRTAVYLSMNWPVAVFSCSARADGTVEANLSRFGVRANAGKLPERITVEAGRVIQFGVDLPVRIDPLAFPPCEAGSAIAHGS